MSRQKLFSTFLVAALMAVSSPSFAGSVNATAVQSISVTTGGFVTVLFTKAVSGRPACASSTNELVFDATTNGGRALLSTLSGAKLSGRNVNASGTNTCTGPRENMSSLTLL